MRVLRGLLTLAFCLAPAVAQATTLPARHLAGRPACQFMVPVDWQVAAFSWEGPCQGGMAHGQGVMRSFRTGEPVLLFFGEVEHGQPHLGVIEGRDGYQAGQFKEGRLLPEQGRNEIIQAFRSASLAAKTFSVRLRQAGNTRSAEFYLKKSQELAQQMD